MAWLLRHGSPPANNYRFRLHRRPETKQGIEGKIVTFRSGRFRVRVRVRDKDRQSEAINFGACV